MKTTNHSILYNIPGTYDLVPESPRRSCHLIKEPAWSYPADEGLGQQMWKTVAGQIYVTEFKGIGYHDKLTFNAPPLFQTRVLYPAPAVGNLAQRLDKLEAGLTATIHYTSQLSLQPETIRHALESVGKTAGHIANSTGAGIRGLLGAAWSGLTSLGSTVLSPILHTLGTFLTIALSLLAAIIVAYLLYNYCLYAYIRKCACCGPRRGPGERRLLRLQRAYNWRGPNLGNPDYFSVHWNRATSNVTFQPQTQSLGSLGSETLMEMGSVGRDNQSCETERESSPVRGATPHSVGRLSRSRGATPFAALTDRV